jgi:hypothetical protein
MSITFYHKDNKQKFYTLNGSTVSWEWANDKGSVTYAPYLIDLFFAEGTWVKTLHQAVSGSNWQVKVDAEGKKFVSGFGLGITDVQGNKAAVTESAAEAGVSKSGAIASDGGSSTYYDIGLPQWLVERIVERQKDGRAYLKTEELIEVAFNNDFDASNITKSLVRAWGAFNGGGKKGNTVDYDLNKMVYSTEKLRQRAQRKQQEAA